MQPNPSSHPSTPTPSSPDIDSRIRQAQQCWAQGQAAEAQGQYRQAYELFTAAHDLVIDCPELHGYAHKQLRRVNWQIRNFGELMTDWALAVFAPLGVFHLVAYFSRSEGARNKEPRSEARLHAACRRA